jgi:DNA excision repair protein ERCC-2
MKRELRISVRDLVDYALRCGDLDLTSFGSGHPVEAIRAHQKVQRSRPTEYTPEIPVHHRIETDNYVLEVGGRIDGLYDYADRVIIDEIKTTTKDLNQIIQTENESHWGQAKCYAYIYALQHHLEHIEVQLTYVHLEYEAQKELRRSFDRNTLQKFFDTLVAQYLQWADTIVEWLQTRNDSINALSFPFTIYRPGQNEMMEEVASAINQGSQLLIQAPTGIGKTMAVIFPSLKALAHGHVAKVFYLTARTTGKTAAETALDVLRNSGLNLKSLTLTAKEKICFNSEKLCNGDDCTFAKGYYDRINKALKDAFTHDSFTRASIISLAKKHHVCPFEFSLELSLWVDCIIGDYNYAFDPRVYLKRFFQDYDTDYMLLVDEAHNLIDRAREMFSAEVHKQPVLALRRQLKNRLPQVYHTLGKLNSLILAERKKCSEEGNPRAQRELPDDVCTVLREFTGQAEGWLKLNLSLPFRQQLLDFYFEAKRFLHTAERYDDNYATCYIHSDNDFCIKLFCIDPARHLRETLGRIRTSIFFSATLSPMHYFIESLGCDDSASTLMLPSPFDNANLCVLIAGRISALYKYREFTKVDVARAISLLIDQKRGNYIIYFPSYEYMTMVYEIFRARRPRIQTIVQSARMTEHDRETFIEKFSAVTNNHLIGFAVMGGVFAESIDLLGDRLTGAVIVGVGLPPRSLERELIKNYFDAINESGFAFAYVYPGMIKVLQAAGRVIRSETDRGVILLVDTRFTTPAYRSLLPQEWRPVLVNRFDSIGDVLKDFWRK